MWTSIAAWLAGKAWWLAVALALVGCGFAIGWHFGGQSSEIKLLGVQKSQAESALKLTSAALSQEHASALRYENEAQVLRNAQHDFPVVSLRVCPSAPTSTAPTAGDREPAAASVVSPGPQPLPDSGPDYGPFLFHLADLADGIVADCRRTQPVAGEYPGTSLKNSR